MKVSTKGRYALRLMVDLAIHYNCGFVSLKDISDRQGISKKYLEQIIAVFAKSHLLRTNRGSQGGYMLAVSPDQCTVGDILRLTEGSISIVDCVDQDPQICDRITFCPTLPVWKGLSKLINEYLDGITLQDIIDQHVSSGGDDYVI